MTYRGRSHQTWLLGGAAAVAMMQAGAAAAQDAEFNIAPQPLASALNEFSVQSRQSVLFTTDLAQAKTSQGVSGQVEVADALSSILAGTGLTWRRQGDTFLVMRADADPQSGSAAGDGAEVEALIVTAQKREEDIQDVPIAISAFTQEDLTRSQVAGGPDLMTQVPNMTFTKTNFTSYSIQIRGIGTQAISATTDAAVAVAFNNTPFIRNRFFEQEFYDLQRVEVLRGPQGTLYGRNATAGVVNIISAKPAFGYEAKISADVANYSSMRLEGMLNIPLVEDKVALRLAGAWTKRDGFVTNENTGEQTDGRDLWSTRMSLRFAPTDALDVNLIWEHFEEDDDRLRSGKQLCHTDEVTNVAGFPTTHYQTLPLSGQSGEILFGGVQGTFSQGCRPASMYSPDSYQTPSGLSVPYYGPLVFLQFPVALDDPYEGRFQSSDLRVIQSTVEPIYQAKSDVVELQVNFDLNDSLTIASETAYAVDEVFSMQDFNRFNTAPGAWSTTSPAGQASIALGVLDEDGFYCDPQVGCSDRLVAVDLSTARSSHFSQELRLSSDYEGPFNFSLGANFLRYDTEDKYYVFINSLGMLAAFRGLNPYVSGVSDNRECLKNGAQPGKYQGYPFSGCLYIDPNPIGALNDQGHNYFLSKNPYKLISYAVFGETYYNLAENLKVTAGVRWTVDKKEAPRVPSWLLAPESVGYPVIEVVEQEWQEPTGRLSIDWKPDLSFTDETLVYASAARGYKAGGANPPPYVPVFYAGGDMQVAANARLAESNSKPKTFDPEFVNAFEVGAKNTFADGRLTLNLAAFYYDYSGYQISQIVDRSAANLNFDAEVWGLEVEADWRPLENLRLGFKGGYENTRVADGEKAIDLMDRTAGRTDWVTVSPFPTFASNCILPAWLFVGYGDFDSDFEDDPVEQLVNLGSITGGGNGGCELAYVLGLDPVTELPYVEDPEVSKNSKLLYHPDYPGWNPLDASQGHNNGEGFFKDLSGNELPNAPHFTATITADYTVPLPNDWLATLHTDIYYQSEAWTRIFNTEGYDKLKAYTNVNLAAIFSNEEAGWRVMAYVKNVFDRDSITGAFLNSDDTGLTTNVFLTEPRLYGLRVTKEWNGGPWWTGANPDHTGPYPLTVEIGGQVQRHDAVNETMSPSFLSAFSDELNPMNLQNRGLDWGDGRQLKLTYQPSGASWSISAAFRTGETNTGTMRARREEAAGGPECGVTPEFVELFEELSGLPFPFSCDPEAPNYQPAAINRAVNWTDSEVRQREEYAVAEFMVGKEVGLGGLADSSVAVGLRYARLKSGTGALMDGIPNWNLPDNWILAVTYSTHNRYTSEHNAAREFEGFGPAVSWDAALALLGNDQTGRVRADWSVGGSLLFGKQEAAITGYERSGDFSGTYGGGLLSSFDPTLDNVVVAPLDIPTRSEGVTVPVVDVSLGLSYEIKRLKVGAGYRWGRFFDAIDGGLHEASRQDRTIDGPYFKLSVGFGG